MSSGEGQSEGERTGMGEKRKRKKKWMVAAETHDLWRGGMPVWGVLVERMGLDRTQF